MPTPRRVVDAESIRAGVNRTGSTIPKERLVQDTAAIQGVTPCTGVGDVPAGVTMEEILDDQTGDIQVFRKAVVEAGAAIVIGVEITSDAVGRAVTAVATNQVAGKAVTAAAALGDRIEVELYGTPHVML